MLFGTDIQRVIGAALGPSLLPATLHRGARTVAVTGDTVVTWADRPCRAVRLDWDVETRVRRGYPETAARVLVLQYGISAPPVIGDHVTVAGARWQIVDRMQDAADATWTLAVVPVTGGV